MKLNFCPECGAKLTAKSPTAYVCDKGHPYWNNAKATVGIAIAKGNTILFAKRARDPYKNKYDLPGGFVDFGENIWQAAIREAKEETGLSISDLVLIDSTSQIYEENVAACDISILARKWTGSLKADDDVAALEWKLIEFIDGPKFTWDYKGVSEKIKSYFEGDSND